MLAGFFCLLLKECTFSAIFLTDLHSATNHTTKNIFLLTQLKSSMISCVVNIVKSKVVGIRVNTIISGVQKRIYV